MTTTWTAVEERIAWTATEDPSYQFVVLRPTSVTLSGGGGGSGDVVGPESATDGAVALFDGTTGKLLQDGPTLGTAATADTGTGASNVILGNDSRLTDARTPTSHTHAASDITSGTMATARLGSGTASAATVLTGAQTYVERSRIIGGQDDGSQITNQTDVSLLDASITMPALAAGEALHFTGSYRWNNSAGAGRGAIFIVKVGSTNIVTCGTSLLGSNVADRVGTFSGYIRANASADCDAAFHCHHFAQSVDTPGALGSVYGVATEAIQTAGLAFDICGTAPLNVQLQLQSLTVWKVGA